MTAAGNSEVAAHRREQESLPFAQALQRRHRSQRTRPMGVDLPIARRFPDIGKIDWRQIDFARFSFTPDAVLGPLASAF